MTYRVFAFILRTRKWGKLSFFSTLFPSFLLLHPQAEELGLEILSLDRTTSTA